MKQKIYTIMLLLFASSFVSIAQNKVCYSQELVDRALQNPEIAKKRKITNELLHNMNQQSQSWLDQFRMDQNGNVYQIPVVFHIVHNGDAIGVNENISDAQVLAQLDQLNDDFRRVNTDAGNTLSSFAGVAADTEIEFCLVSVDPQGNPTTGILRHQGSSASYNPDQNTFANQIQQPNYWNPNSYLNIWSVNLTGGILGYAYFPNTAPNAWTDGVVCLYSSFGSLSQPFSGAAPYNRGRTCTHEVGHWLNLPHVWGNSGGCNNDDGVSDTPTQSGPNYGCPNNPNTCGSADMYQNYMDYVDDDCMNLFTQGQKTRMRNAITGARSGLITSPCGVVDPCAGITPSVTPTSVDFCNTNFTNLTSSGAPAGLTYQWYNDGVAIPGATSQQLGVSSVGNYSVQFTDGNCSTDASNIVAADCSNCVSAPTISPSGTVDICAGPVTLTASGYTGTIEWYLDGTATGITSATFEAEGNGEITAIATDGNCITPPSNIVTAECNASSDCLISIDVTIPGYFTANDFITSNSALPAGSTTVMLAGNYIELQAGFEGNQTLYADIETCEVTPLGPLISENFNACSAPAGWTSYGISGTGTGTSSVLWGQTSMPDGSVSGAPDPAGFDGCIALIDDDAGGSGDDQTTCIETPVLDISNYPNATLSLSWCNQVYEAGSADEVGFIQVFDGSTWNTILSTDEESSSELETPSVTAADCNNTSMPGGPAGDPDVFDLSCFNNTDFKVRICYDDNGDWGWGIGFDNLIIE